MNLLYYIVLLALILPSTEIRAGKTGQPIYVHPFDYAAGGTNLCLASHEGVLFSNPAVMPFGNKFFRWVGIKTVVIAAPESLVILSGGSQSGNLIEDAFNSPIHIGLQSIFSFISNNIGVSLIATAEPDISVKRFGEFGLPEIRVQTDAYAGAMIGGGFKVKKWLSFGLGVKALRVNEEDKRTDITDGKSISNAIDGVSNISFSNIDTYGYDIGSVILLQSKYFDYRFALKADDVGGTRNGAGETVFLPTYHVGTSVTLHSTSDMIHLEVDYRDISNAYDEPLFKKVYAGGKLTVENIIGISAGIHHGYPAFGLAFDVILVNLGASYYIKEMGDYPGEDPRQLISFYFNLGI